MSQDATRARFAAAAEKLAALGESRVDASRERLRRFVEPVGTERALDVGTGTGMLAFALAPLVHEVVGIDLVPEMLAHARAAGAGYPNVSFHEGSALALPFADGEFDLSVTSRTIHHVPHPEVAVAEMTRVTRIGGHLLVVDQISSSDPLEALQQNRLEHLRDPSHERILSDLDFRSLFEANWLVLERFETEREAYELDHYLELASCTGERRDAVIAEVERLLASGRHAGVGLRRSENGYALTLTVAWYLMHRAVPDRTDL
jgi:SAM-dependent methyltransferase